MTEQTWKERFRKQYQYWDLTSEEDLSDLEAFIAAERATARAEGAAEEREKPPLSLYREMKSENDAIVLSILIECKKQNVKPTLEQIKESMEAKSLTTVQRSLVRLEKIGLVKRDKYKKRSWQALTTKEHHAS